VLDANDPISLCFLIDDSESTKELSQAIVRSAATIADSLPPKSEIAIIHFADKAFVDLPLTPIEKVDPKSFSFAQHRGATAFYDATVATVEYLAKRAHYRRRAIVLITDGVDNESTLNLDQAVKRMSQPSAPILYALFFRENNMSGAELRHATRALEILTNASGGLVFRPVEKKGVRPADAAAEAANSLATAIHSQIVVTYTSSNPSHDGKPRNVEVTLPKTQSEIRFQRTYIAVSKFGGM
jgi:uncharacterized protein YegL